jgi:DNA segregation ATPase FtsK/SpoIIIE-like protein
LLASVPPARPVEPERPKPVDQGIASVIAKASAQAGDTRTTADLVDGALRIVTNLGGVSVPALQRKLEIDFAKATELVEKLEAEGYISAPGAHGKRKVLPSAFEYVERQDASPGEA